MAKQQLRKAETQKELLRASSEAFRVLATARVLDGHDCWGPMALAGGRLLIRDLTRLSCLDLRKP